MTDGADALRDKPPMCVRVWLELGHASEAPRASALGRSLARDWRVWVRGARGTDISRYVHKVVFYLHPASAFVYPKRVIQEPPYEIQESGCASLEIPIHVYLKHSNKPKKIRLKYSLQVASETRGGCERQCVFYDFENPSEPLWRSLMQGGGEAVARALAPPASPAAPAPAPGRHRRRRPRCSCAPDLRRLLPVGPADLTRDEADRVSQLSASLRRYERSRGALRLPAFSDPIYRVPEPPRSLQALAAAPAPRPGASPGHTADCLQF